MKKYIINDLEYELIKNYKDGFSLEEIKEKVTDYFIPFDYIVGDWSYGKIRLKGFFDENNKQCKKENNIEYVEDYLRKFCSYECRYFILKKK